MLAFEATSTQYSHPSPSLDNLDSSKESRCQALKIRAFNHPRPIFLPFFLKPSHTSKTGSHLYVDKRPLARRRVAPYRTLLHNASMPGIQVLPSSLRVYVPTSSPALTPHTPLAPSSAAARLAVLGSRHACGLFAAASWWGLSRRVRRCSRLSSPAVG